MTIRLPLALALTTLTAASATAQTTVIDEGSFRIAVRGSAIGNETFTIRRSGAGANATVVAQGRIVLDTGEQTRTVIQFRGDPITPAAYQVEVTGDNRQSITGRATGGRFRATMVSNASERMREFLIDGDAVVLDDAVAHHHFFLAHRAADPPSTIPVILPRESRQVNARVQFQGTETIRIGGQQVEARRLSVTLEGFDDRTLWVDDENRVLRIRVPEQDLTAERASLP